MIPGAGRCPEQVARAFVDACLLDVTALKPGNVGLHGAGHGMSVADFIRSAPAAAREIAAPDATVGERIARAVTATHAAVGMNTNLGIVLLTAPLAHTALMASGRLEAVLAGLSVGDAAHAFQAIRMAAPGGLGTSARHDVAAPARVTLLEAMREAAPRDRIAFQYDSGFADVLGLGRSALDAARSRGLDWRSTATEVFMAFLTRYPDSHVRRKLGASRATALRDAASALATQEAAQRPGRTARLVAWDRELKAGGVNPGTSADLTVATLFAAFLDDGSGWSAGTGCPGTCARDGGGVSAHR